MKILDRGHRYVLYGIDGPLSQELVFVKREGPHYPGNVGSHCGTTMQEVIRALLDRARHVNTQIPCHETEGVINSLETALLLLEVRAARVKDRHLAAPSIKALEDEPTCPTCGHVQCREHKRNGDSHK